MKNRNRNHTPWREKPERTVGLDLGDRFSSYCILQEQGEVIEEGRIPTTEKGLRKQFANSPRLRIALECGTHSPWVSRLLEQLGHQVIVANAREVHSITHSVSKSDPHDAEQLARLAHSDPRLLKPIQHRSPERQQDLNLLRARHTLVRARTLVVNSLRGLVKSAGGRLPKCSTESFPQRAAAHLPASIASLAAPLLEQVASFNTHIAALDQQIEALAQRDPAIALLRTAPGVGPLVAAAYVLTLDRHDSVAHSRQVGARLGLRPKQHQSGDGDPQRGITKISNRYLRTLLVQSAHYVLGPFGPDSALRRWGLKLAGTGNQGAKKRAVVAVARKLAVLLHAMWRTGQCYQPFPPSARARAVPNRNP
jgi:transposase